MGQSLRFRFLLLTLVLAVTACFAQDTVGTSKAADTVLEQSRNLEDLNFRGGDAAMPPIADSVVDAASPYRKALFDKGIALRLVSMENFAQNSLRAPVAADDQAYVGERPYESAMLQPILTADLRQLHLNHAQFYLSGVWNWASWEPAGPKTFDLWSMYLYKEFAGDRVEAKAGYSTNDLDFVGMQVGGSTANEVQGVYAVLPYEVGMAYFPLTAPEFNLKLRGPSNTYLKAGAQRSFDAGGGPATEARNHTGFRFDPKGDKLLEIDEAGYRRSSSSVAHQAWVRAGYMRNSTLYTNQTNNRQEPGNFCSYALMDYQVRQPDSAQPSHGLYLGGSAMTAPARFDPYNRYFEARLYRIAPFRSRPGDVASVVSSYTEHSRYFTNPLVAEGKTVWRNAASMTGSYTTHVARGLHMSLGLSYIHGPAIAPRAPDTLTFTATSLVCF